MIIFFYLSVFCDSVISCCGVNFLAFLYIVLLSLSVFSKALSENENFPWFSMHIECYGDAATNLCSLD